MAKQQNTAPSIAEFEDWDETKETEALAEVAKQIKVRHIIKDNEYWALAPGGTVYKLPLYLSIADFEACPALPPTPTASTRSNASSPCSPETSRPSSSKGSPCRSRSTSSRTTGRRSPNHRASNWENRRLLPNPQLR